jgi:hypothetical protein
MAKARKTAAKKIREAALSLFNKRKASRKSKTAQRREEEKEARKKGRTGQLSPTKIDTKKQNGKGTKTDTKKQNGKGTKTETKKNLPALSDKKLPVKASTRSQLPVKTSGKGEITRVPGPKKGLSRGARIGIGTAAAGAAAGIGSQLSRKDSAAENRKAQRKARAEADYEKAMKAREARDAARRAAASATTTTTGGKATGSGKKGRRLKGKLLPRIRPFKGKIARALLGKDEQFGGEAGLIDPDLGLGIRRKAKGGSVNKKKMYGGGMASKGGAKGGAKGGPRRMKTGGMTKKQGYNDRLDESLGERDGKESTKSQSFKSRRNESRGASKPVKKASKPRTPESAGAAKRGWGAVMK